MTKGNSTRRKSRLPGWLYSNFDPGNEDKLMISYKRERSHDYTMSGACGVIIEGEIHFFGGDLRYFEDGIVITSDEENNNEVFIKQHFVIETQRSGQTVEMIKKEDLEIGFRRPSCRSFEMTSEHFPWFQTNIAVLCFDRHHSKSCYSFDAKLTYIGDSYFDHFRGGLTRYKNNLLTVGGGVESESNFYVEYDERNNQKTEILQRDIHGGFSWIVVDQDFKFIEGNQIKGHSLVTVKSSDINEEYVLLVGGFGRAHYSTSYVTTIFKFNGTWSSFGHLNKPRIYFNSIYWNKAVYVIGGGYREYHQCSIEGEKLQTTTDPLAYLKPFTFNFKLFPSYEDETRCDYLQEVKTKMDIWNIEDSPNEFQTTENWPELDNWMNPHLFIVQDSFFPDH